MPEENKTLVAWTAIAAALLVQGPALGEDSPCAPRPGMFGQGFVCVCNSSYCDTVETPEKLPSTHYYQYKTSNTTPGFNRVQGLFRQELAPDEEYDAVFTINPSVTYQEIVGFGGSITDSSSLIVYKYLPFDAANKLIESYFSSSGIEYSMLRLPIGGTDFSPRSYTLDDVPYDVELKYFDLSIEDRCLKIPAIRRAMGKSARGIKLMACTWMTPAWMKAGDTPYTGFLAEKYQEVWARYHIRFLQEYQKENLTIWSLSGNNEGVLQFVVPLAQGLLNSTLTLAPQARHWLKNYLKPLLIANNFTDVKFFGLEDERAFAPYWMDTFARDPGAYEAIDGLALHWYSDFFIPVEIIDQMHEKHPNKVILYTESSVNQEFDENYTVILGSWHRAEAYLYYIMENLDHWVSGWLDWNLALDIDGGPTLTTGLDASIIVNKTSEEFYKQPTFYAMGHFSKFLPPGALRVNVTPSVYPTGTDGMTKEARREMLRRRLQLGIVLPSITIPEVVRCLATSNPDGSFTAVVLNTMNETAKVKIEDDRVGKITVDIEQHSVYSFVYWP